MSPSPHTLTATEPVTLETQAPHNPELQKAAPDAVPAKNNVMRITGITTGVVAAVAGTFLAYKTLSSAEESRPHSQPEAAQHDPHGNAEHQSHMKLAVDTSVIQEALQKKELGHFRKEAEEALLLLSFYETDGHTEKIQECLGALQKWKKAYGNPTFSKADGLVISRSKEESVEMDFYERVTKAIDRLAQPNTEEHKELATE